jgi:two-component system, NarL family, sensor histidine kinase DegS
MAALNEILSRPVFFNILRVPHLWVIIPIIIILTVFYYLLQFSRIAVIELFPIAQSLMTFEYIYNLVGILFYIPLLYSLIYWGRGVLIVWLLSIVCILPRIIYFYNDNLVRILGNVFFLSIPFLVFAYISLQLQWRDRERKIAEDKEKERQNYLGEIFKAEEDERMRISREIHDDSIQRLAVIATDAQLLSGDKQLYKLPDIQKRAESIRDMIISVSHDLRRLSLNLRPTVLDDLGLVPAIRWLIDGFKQETGIDTHLEITGENVQLSKKCTVNVFRIVQEALSNVRQHSGARSVEISLQFTNEMLAIQVQDDGSGFLLPGTNAELTSKGKLGLIGMQQRARLLNGLISYQSEIGKGTTISAEVYLLH